MNRQEAIHSKGFNMGHLDGGIVDYGKIKVGVKNLDDAVLNLGSLKTAERAYTDKAMILKALADRDCGQLRAISKYYFATSGIYRRVCEYAAMLYRYDWYVEPEVFDIQIKPEKVLADFSKILSYLDNSHIRKICGDIALKVVVEGAYYGYVVPSNDKIVLQELPINYCRSRYSVGDMPAIEFNMKFFDDQFRDINYRMRVLKMFPEEFQKGYVLYKKGKLLPDYAGDTSGSWYLLDPKATIKFTFGGNLGDCSDVPLFVNSIPHILDLDAAQDLDRRKQMQKLLKILIQKLPLDKNGDLIFDVDEARDLHNNAVEMLQRAVGVDVLTTFADVSVENMSDTNTSTTQDDLAKVERSLFNSMGIAQNLLNPDGNIALEKSILTDEASFRQLLLQFQIFFDRLTQSKNPNKKKYNFKFQMLETTQYNYKELSKMYKEHVQLGYSKMLPQIALGHNQSSILNTAYFENEILKLSEIMIPPLSSNTMNADAILNKGNNDNKDNNNNSKTNTKTTTVTTEEKTPGRKEKPNDEKSEKTLQNRESMS